MTSNKTVMTRPAELASFNVAHSDDAILQPRALLHHPRVCTLKDLTLAGHVITITYSTILETIEKRIGAFGKEK